MKPFKCFNYDQIRLNLLTMAVAYLDVNEMIKVTYNTCLCNLVVTGA